MAARIGALVIHGMGSQEPGFSADLLGAINWELGENAERVVWEEIYWADVLEGRETDLSNAMARATSPGGERIPLDWGPARQFVIHNFGDAIAYHNDFAAADDTSTLIHRRVSEKVGVLATRLGDPVAPVVVFAHSLGGHIMSNYIWDRQHESIPGRYVPIPTLAGMITFGCNIPLFSLAFPEAVPIDLPGAGITKPQVRQMVRWLNFVDRDDVLGWPMRPLYEKNRRILSGSAQDTVDRIRDYEINVGGPLTSWNPGSHAQYWADGDLTRAAARYLAELLDAVDA